MTKIYLKTEPNARVNGEMHTHLDDSSDRLVPVISSHGGLTKREYFAVMAIQGQIANGGYGDSWEQEAKTAVQVADALIAALNEEPK